MKDTPTPPGWWRGETEVTYTMQNTKTLPVRYTINRDGTLEKWYLLHDGGDFVFLQKSPRLKWICYNKEFSPSEVYSSRKEAMAALKQRIQ